MQTHVLAELGAHDEARAALEALTRDRCAALPFDEEWLVSTCLLADAAVVLGAAEAATAALRAPGARTTTTSPSATRR